MQVCRKLSPDNVPIFYKIDTRLRRGREEEGARAESWGAGR